MARLPGLLLWVLIALAVLLPSLDALTHLHATPLPIPSAQDWARLLRSFLYSLLIACLASFLALPVAWRLRSAPRAWWPFLPLLLPNYLAYAGWQRLIAPGSALGDLLARGPAEGENWWPLAATRALAVFALAAWSWPLAFLIQREAFSRLDDSLLGSLRLDAPRAARTRTILRHAAPALISGSVLVALVTLGSAIPLHLAQVDSYALALWTRLTLAAPHELGSVWLAAWPCALAALAGAIFITRRIAAPTEPSTPARAPARPALAAVYLLALIAPPLTLLSLELRGLDAFPRFWRLHADAAGNSLFVALAVGLLTALTAGAAWAACAWTRRAPSPGLRLLLIASITWSLTPGVLVGQAWATLCVRPWMPHALADSAAPVILAQFGRLMPLALIAGLALARADAPLRDLRRLDHACRPRALATADVRVVAPLTLACGAAGFALSLHEIEATVMIQPPGSDSLARRMLEMLHYQRMEMLAAGVLAISLAAVAVGLIARVFAPRAAR